MELCTFFEYFIYREVCINRKTSNFQFASRRYAKFFLEKFGIFSNFSLHLMYDLKNYPKRRFSHGFQMKKRAEKDDA